MNIFEQASRQALRFDTPKGQLSVEDLWQLPLQGKGANLDSIGMAINVELDATKTSRSLVRPVATGANAELELKFAIVKHIIDVKMVERDEQAQRAERRARNNRIRELIEQKKDQELAGKSVEELTSLLAASDAE